jgi:biotin-(acetyl-CoA carboxylase) ligase
MNPDWPLTLLPLHCGVITHNAIASVLPASVRHDLTLKWPNDVLFGGKKISGSIIEFDSTGSGGTFLIGIGINVNVAPEVPKTGDNYGRESTCLLDHLPESDDAESDDAERDGRDFRSLIGALADSIATQFSLPPPSAASVVDNFEHRTVFGEPIRIRSKGNELVVPRRIERDGQLVVDVHGTAEVRVLNSEYLL